MKDNFNQYAPYYDLIYKDKNYRKECDFLISIFKKHSRKRPASIIDLACGTGNHLILLAKEGLKVTGSDSSEAMIDIARKKAKKAGLKIDFKTEKMQDFIPNKKFDVVMLLFASIAYLTDRDDLKNTLNNIYNSLNKNGLFICDFWNGSAVLKNFTPSGIKTVKNGQLVIKRKSTKSIDRLKQVCEVNFNFSISKQNKIIDSFSEKHTVRYFFPQEMRNYLEFTGFKVIKTCPFLKLNNEISESDWDITVIAKKTG